MKNVVEKDYELCGATEDNVGWGTDKDPDMMAGEQEFLVLVLYDWNSEFDRSLNLRLGQNRPAIWDPRTERLSDRFEFPASSRRLRFDTPSTNETLATCGEPCYGPRSCHPASGCSCFVPSQANGTYIATCGVAYSSSLSPGRQVTASDLAGTVNGRDGYSFTAAVPITHLEDVSCPCNCTYVSHACCNSRDGIVHEDVSLNLGPLTMSDGVECDQASGKVRSSTSIQIAPATSEG